LNACLDSWAVLAWLDGEQPARDRIEELLDGKPVISWMNAVEVYYRVERDHGRTQADDTLRGLRTICELDLPGTAKMIEVARLKAVMSIALADCFALATAVAHRAVLLTGDPEILDRDDLPCEVEDLRAP
jgi:PIN domain nuclease of toxin-antitoxin system